jgi:hypothetical protein
MFNKFFAKYPEYDIVDKPSEKTVEKFKKLLPETIISFWKEYGFGTFMDGYLKIINPEQYQEVFDTSYENKTNEIVFAVTGLGDFIVWAGDAIRFVNYRHGVDNIIQADGDFYFFLNRNIVDEYCINTECKGKKYFSAKELYGKLEYDECFGYVPILAMGGKETVKNMRKVKIKDHIQMIFEMAGKIE